MKKAFSLVTDTCCELYSVCCDHAEKVGAKKSERPKAHHVLAVAIGIAGVVGFLGVLFTCIKTANAGYSWLVPAAPVPAMAAVAIARPKPVCTKFDESEWQHGQGLLVHEGSAWELATSAPNGMLRYGKAVPLNSEVEIKFVPLSDSQVNFVATMHDLYEVTVGDGGYNGITVKTAGKIGEPMRLATSTEGDRRLAFENGKMEKGAGVTLVLHQEVSRLDSHSYILNLQLARKSYEGSAPANILATYSFALPFVFDIGDESTSSRFSLGLKKASDKSKVKAEILCVSFR